MKAQNPTEQEGGAIKERQREVWALGDFSLIATATVIVSERLCEAADVSPGDRVLDVATGSGNGALAAARRWGEVRGIDFVPSLLERARERARAERLHIGFQLGDAEAIPFPDESFDVVLSVFGAMFAPDHRQTAKELLRVCRPGGKIGMANWTPDGFIGALFSVMAHQGTVPVGPGAPAEWGREEHLRELMGEDLSSWKIRRRSFMFRYHSPQHFVEFYRANYGPTLNSFAGLDGNDQDGLAHALAEVAQQFNRSGGKTMIVPGDYLEVVAVKS